MDAIAATTMIINAFGENPSLSQLPGSKALSSTKKNVTARLSKKATAIMNAKISAISAIVKRSMNDESLLKKFSSDQL